MITTADLKAQTRRELADLARNYGVNGWHGMRKDELIREIGKVQKRPKPTARQTEPVKSTATKPSAAKAPALKASAVKASTVKTKPTSAVSKSVTVAGKTTTAKASGTAKVSAGKVAGGGKSAVQKTAAQKPTATPRRTTVTPPLTPQRVSAKTARIREQMRKRRELMQRNKDLSTATLVAGSAVKNGSQRSRADELHRDRIVLMVRDAYWLQATWEITRASVQRAQSSLAERWYTAAPILRLYSVGDVNGNRAESVMRDIPIHGGVNNWYIDVDEPPARFRVAVGYLDDLDQFHTLCRSNLVETPRPGECERLDEHWRDIAEDYERIYSLSGGYETDNGDLREMFEERLHRSMPSRGEQGQTITETSLIRETKLPFQVDAELIVYGTASPNASVSISGRPVKLQADGSFTVRMELPDKRQVIPVMAESRDGLRQRTTVIAVERNTKVMEAVEIDDKF